MANANLAKAITASLANAAKREAEEVAAAIQAVAAATQKTTINSNAAAAAALAAEFAAQNAAASSELKYEEREDCSNGALYFENRADGNCLFDSIAQIYKPIDISKRSKFKKEVKPISDKLRALLAVAYVKANEGNDEFNRKYKFPINNQITGLDGINRSFIEYSKFIATDARYATDDDLEILSNLLGDISLRVIEQVNVGERIIPRYIDQFNLRGKENISYYTFCNNMGGRHWVLKKGGKLRDFTTDYTRAAGIVGILSDENVEKNLRSKGYNPTTIKTALHTRKLTNDLVTIEERIAANAANASVANANAANANAANANAANVSTRLEMCKKELEELKAKAKPSVASRLRAKVAAAAAQAAAAAKGGNRTRRTKNTKRRRFTLRR